MRGKIELVKNNGGWLSRHDIPLAEITKTPTPWTIGNGQFDICWGSMANSKFAFFPALNIARHFCNFAQFCFLYLTLQDR